MKRWLLPYPLLSLSLLVMWLLLSQSLAPGHLLLGALMGLLGGRAMASLRPEKARIRFGVAALRLTGIVIADIVRSNIAVGRIVLFGRATEGHTSAFIRLPLELTNRYGLAVLAIIITATPGTLWVQHGTNRNVLLIHVLDLVDEEEWVKLIKFRYERLLLEIFR